MASSRNERNVKGSRSTPPGTAGTLLHHENSISSPPESSPVSVLPLTMFVSIKGRGSVQVGARAARRAMTAVEFEELCEHGDLGVGVIVLQQLDPVDRGEGEQ